MGTGLFTLLAATSLVLGGCANDRQVGAEGGSGGGTSATGTSTTTGGVVDHGEQGGGTLTPGPGKTVPASADVQVLWDATGLYAFGKGEVSAGTYDLSLTAPPEEALTSHGVGIGILVLLPQGGAFPEGKLPDADAKAFTDKIIGASVKYAIIYKKVGAAGLSWSEAFPDGYSCGKGVPAAPDETFDTFEPIDCSKVVIIVDSIDKAEFTNWG